tara:strand:+ start:176 stop:334 length:159 start_codon:yes stop_codon:yes gene_type:complete
MYLEEIRMLRNIRFLTIMSLAVCALTISACETIDGAGRDIENAGEVVQDAAN